MVEFPGLEHLFVVDNDDKRSAAHASLETPLAFDQFGQIVSGSITRPDLRFRHVGGGRFYDVVPCSPMFLFISPGLRNALRAFSGWHTTPVTFAPDDPPELASYELLVVDGRCGPLLDVRPTPFEFCRGYFDPSTWDGHDLFSPPGSVSVFATEAVVRALRRARVTNVRFQRLADL
jgi:hypothetical protein